MKAKQLLSIATIGTMLLTPTLAKATEMEYCPNCIYEDDGACVVEYCYDCKVNYGMIEEQKYCPNCKMQIEECECLELSEQHCQECGQVYYMCDCGRDKVIYILGNHGFEVMFVEDITMEDGIHASHYQVVGTNTSFVVFENEDIVTGISLVTSDFGSGIVENILKALHGELIGLDKDVVVSIDVYGDVIDMLIQVK